MENKSWREHWMNITIITVKSQRLSHWTTGVEMLLKDLNNVLIIDCKTKAKLLPCLSFLRMAITLNWSIVVKWSWTPSPGMSRVLAYARLRMCWFLSKTHTQRISDEIQLNATETTIGFPKFNTKYHRNAVGSENCMVKSIGTSHKCLLQW